jgi:Double zinc ribbon
MAGSGGMTSGTMLVCTSCGYEEPDGSRFCGNCGAPFEPPAAEEIASSPPTLTCASCGNEEPEGSHVCGNCGAPFEPAEQSLADTEASLPVADHPSPDESRPPHAPTRQHRRRWIAAGAVVALLLAAGAAAAVLSLTGGDSTEATATEEQPLPSTSSATDPLETSPTLADSITPRLEEVVAAQTTVNAGVRALGTGPESFATLRQTADSLAASVARAQGVLDTLAPSDSTEASTLSLLRLALSGHLAYANTISGFPAEPQSFTTAQAQGAIARAEQARRAYVDLVSADASLPIVYISGSDHSSLLAIVPAPKPTRPTVAQRVVDLAPLLVGIRPDDLVGEGRCFGPYTPRATLSVSGVVYGSGFIQCGDDSAGDPSRASGVYRFSGRTFPAGSRLARVTAQAAIDESSSPSQRGSRVTWTVIYDGAPVCTANAVWSASRPSPVKLDCRVPPSASPGGIDLRRLRIQQVAFPASSGSLWAGLLNAKIVVEVPGR